MKQFILSSIFIFVLFTGIRAQRNMLFAYEGNTGSNHLCSFVYLPETVINGMRAELQKKYPNAFVNGIRTLTTVECWGFDYDKAETLVRRIRRTQDSVAALADGKHYELIMKKEGNSKALNDISRNGMDGWDRSYYGKIDGKKTKKNRRDHEHGKVYSEIICFNFKDCKKGAKPEIRVMLFEGEFHEAALRDIQKLTAAIMGDCPCKPGTQADQRFFANEKESIGLNALILTAQ